MGRNVEPVPDGLSDVLAMSRSASDRIMQSQTRGLNTALGRALTSYSSRSEPAREVAVADFHVMAPTCSRMGSMGSLATLEGISDIDLILVRYRFQP